MAPTDLHKPDSPVYSPLEQAKEPRLRARGGPLAKIFQNVCTITMSGIQKAETLKSLHPPCIFNIKGHHELHRTGDDGLSHDLLSDDRLSNDRLSDNCLSDDRLSNDGLSNDRLSDDCLSDDRLELTVIMKYFVIRTTTASDPSSPGIRALGTN